MFFKVTDLTIHELGLAICTAAVSVLWFEIYKLFKRKSDNF